uniref:Uncharacterized protein n=1 Tax=Oryza meridionalis TaxID=40149 RepID=A0A0E0DBP0_9ORYZ
MGDGRWYCRLERSLLDWSDTVNNSVVGGLFAGKCSSKSGAPPIPVVESSLARGGEPALVGRFAWSLRASTLPALCFSCVSEVPGSVELVHETSATQPVDGVWGGVGAAWPGVASWATITPLLLPFVCWAKSELLVGDKLGNDNPLPLSMVTLW